MDKTRKAQQLIADIENQLVEVKYHLERGSIDSAAIKSEFVKKPANRLFELLNESSK